MDNNNLIKEFIFNEYKHRNQIPDDLSDYELIEEKLDDYTYGIVCRSLLFYNEKNNEIMEIYSHDRYPDTYFENHSVRIIQTRKNVFKIDNIVDNDVAIIKHKLKKYGIDSYKIKEVVKNRFKFNGSTKFEKYTRLSFDKNAGSEIAAFLFYFNDYFQPPKEY